MAGSSPAMTRRKDFPRTALRMRGEVDLGAELWRSEASRVRGRLHRLGLAVRPPHPDSFAPQELRSESDLSPQAPASGERWEQAALPERPRRFAGNLGSEIRGELG